MAERRHKAGFGGFGSVVRLGMPRGYVTDAYAWLLEVHFIVLLLFFAVAYLGTNVFFAALYLMVGDCINGAEPGSFADAFYFSVQTLSTIGYGGMTPKGIGNTFVAVESIVGLVGLALSTGLVFSKFSRPTARVLFSDKVVINRRDGVPHLAFRVANSRGNEIIEAFIRVTVLLSERTKEGEPMRGLHDLELRRNTTPVFALSWSVLHRIDDTSPLHGLEFDELRAQDARIIVSFTGIDTTFSQTVHTYHMYFPEDVAFAERFVDVIDAAADGTITLDLRKFHDTVPIGSKEN